MSNQHGFVDSTQPIIILDSGMGGAIVEKRFKEKYPHENTILLIDNAFMPYGTKTTREVRERIKKVMRKIVELNPKALIIGCNTIDSLAMDIIFNTYPDLPTVQIVAPSARQAIEASKKKSIAVLATKATIESKSYLMNSGLYFPNTKVIGVECENLAYAIEMGENIKATFNQEVELLAKEEFDCIVLGCTHYAKIKPLVTKKFPNVKIIDSTQAVVSEFEKLLPRIILQASNKIGKTRVLCTGDIDTNYFSKLYATVEIEKIEI